MLLLNKEAPQHVVVYRNTVDNTHRSVNFEWLMTILDIALMFLVGRNFSFESVLILNYHVVPGANPARQVSGRGAILVIFGSKVSIGLH